MAALDALWIWIVMPIIGTATGAIGALVIDRATPAQAFAGFSGYFPGRVLTAAGQTNYFATTMILGWIILAAIDIAILASAFKPHMDPNPILDAQPPAAGANEHGNARVLRTPKEIRAESDIYTITRAEIEAIPSEGKPESRFGVYLGMFDDEVFTFDNDVHTLILAPTRSGKTRKVLVEMIATLGYAHESMMIFDPKGELFGYTCEFLRRIGHEINRIDLQNPDYGNLWNPLYRAIEYYRQISCMPPIDLDALKAHERLVEEREAAKSRAYDAYDRMKSLEKELEGRPGDAELSARLEKARQENRELQDEKRRLMIKCTATSFGHMPAEEDMDELLELMKAKNEAHAEYRRLIADGEAEDDEVRAKAEDVWREACLRYFVKLYDYPLDEDEVAFEKMHVELASDSWRPRDLFRQVDDIHEMMASARTAEESAAANKYYNAKKEQLDELVKKCENEVDKIIDTIHPRDEAKADASKFFQDGADNIMKMAFHYTLGTMTCPEESKTPRTAMNIMMKYISPQAINPADRNDKRSAVALYQDISRLSSEHPAFKYKSILENDSQYISNFVNEAAGIMADFASVAINRMMKGTDYTMEDLVAGEKPVATFIMIPSNATEAMKRFALLYIDQMYDVLMQYAHICGGRLPRRMNMICEELGQLPPITNLNERLSISGGAGIRWVLVLQDFSQLDDKYTRDVRETIVNNTQNKVLLETDDNNTAKYFSEKLGNYTIEKASTSSSKAPTGFFTDRVSDSTQLAQRERLSVSEIMQWKSDYGAILWRHGHPACIMRIPDLSQTFFEEALGTGDREHNNAKIAAALANKTHPQADVVEDWGPEIDSFAKLERLSHHRYRDSKRRQMAEDHMTGLLSKAKEEADKREKWRGGNGGKGKGKGGKQGGGNGGSGQQKPKQGGGQQKPQPNANAEDEYPW